ncbi:hypothetical protein COLO4_27573 [Corchorus olitorius]|uniref:RING-type E3 ubiquitin transferase n=1 Tax=Corchorus olitorius TaxID=93759 RepID=A0A1R3HQY0_9ROSI|nr:hypothetical protein COLO4_27573 [Corchorus olitorius]
MKNLPALFCLIIFILFINVNNGQTCSSSCGNIPIKYPFRLSKDPSNCGDRDYELSCLENNSTILYFRKGFYYVKKISYEEHIIRVVDVNFANGSCGLPNRDLTLDQLYNDPLYPGITKNYTYSYTLNYLRCSSEISDLGKSRVACLSGDVYVKLTSYYETLSFLEIPSSCKLISTVPGYYEDEMLEQKKPSYETILKMQESGFDMVWSVGCRECKSRRRRSRCSQRFPSTTEFECMQLYDDEYYEEIRQLIIGLSVVSVGGLIGFFRFILLPLVIFAFLLHKCCCSRDH